MAPLDNGNGHAHLALSSQLLDSPEIHLIHKTSVENTALSRGLNKTLDAVVASNVAKIRVKVFKKEFDRPESKREYPEDVVKAAQMAARKRAAKAIRKQKALDLATEEELERAAEPVRWYMKKTNPAEPPATSLSKARSHAFYLMEQAKEKRRKAEEEKIKDEKCAWKVTFRTLKERSEHRRKVKQ
jgi:hypothetical protein